MVDNTYVEHPEEEDLEEEDLGKAQEALGEVLVEVLEEGIADTGLEEDPIAVEAGPTAEVDPIAAEHPQLVVEELPYLSISTLT